MHVLISTRNRSRRAFSLIELLITIAVIGVITGIATTVMSHVQNRSEESTAKRHAQIVASMAENAIHAGDTQISGAADKESALSILASGVHGTGSFAGVRFRLDLTEQEQTQTLPYLEFVEGRLKAVLDPD